MGYCHALVRAMDSHLARDSAVRVTVLVDARSHHGDYPNAKMWALTGATIWRHLSALYKAIQFYFPERLERAIVFPVDAMEDMILRMVKRQLSKTTQQKLTLVCGPSARGDPTPAGLFQYVDYENLYAESRRFICK